MNNYGSLFGLQMPMPDEIRQNVANRLFSSSPVFGGMFGPSYTAAQQIGRGLGFALAGPSKEEQASEQIQNIIRRRVEQYEGEAMGDDFLREVGPLVAQDLMEKGHSDMALSIMQKIPQPVDNYDKVKTLQTSIDKETKDIRAIESSQKAIKAQAKQRTVPGDQAMIFTWMKILDPNSTVREGEYATASNTTVVPAWIMQLYNKAKDGELLREEDRQNFLNAVESTVDARRESADSNIDYILQRADAEGVNRSRVMGKDRYAQYQQRRALYTPPEGVEPELWSGMTLAQKRKYMRLGE